MKTQIQGCTHTGRRMSVRGRENFCREILKEAERFATVCDMSPQAIESIRSPSFQSDSDGMCAIMKYIDDVTRAQIVAAITFASVIHKGNISYSSADDLANCDGEKFMVLSIYRRGDCEVSADAPTLRRMGVEVAAPAD